MTVEEQSLLSKGRIPGEIIFPILVQHCDQQDADRGGEVGELSLICERQGLNYNSVARARWRFEHGEDVTLDFDTADKLLCGMRMWDAWYYDLREYYDAIDLSWEQCACEGCIVMIQRTTAPIICRSCNQPMQKNAGRGLCEPCWCSAKRDGTLESYPLLENRRGPVAKYCSPSCASAAQRMGRGEQRRRIKHDLNERCRNGHLRTPENTMTVSNGHGSKTRCRECQKEANARAYAKRRQPVAA